VLIVVDQRVCVCMRVDSGLVMVWIGDGVDWWCVRERASKRM